MLTITHLLLLSAGTCFGFLFHGLLRTDATPEAEAIIIPNFVTLVPHMEDSPMLVEMARQNYWQLRMRGKRPEIALEETLQRSEGLIYVAYQPTEAPHATNPV